MASPTRHPKTGMFQYRARVPADIVAKVRGQTIAVPIAGTIRRIRVGDSVKLSLATRDPAEARERFLAVAVAVNAFWRLVRAGPVDLVPKQVLALAGEIRAVWVDAFDDDPATPELWEGVRNENARAAAGMGPQRLPAIGGKSAAESARFGAMVDAYSAARGLILSDTTRSALITQTALSMADMVKVNHAKASGDYSDTGETKRYPPFLQSVPASASARITFASVIDAEEIARTSGKDAKGFGKRTIAVFRRDAANFTTHRKSQNAATVTTAEVRAWIAHLQAEGRLSNRTIGGTLQNVRTIWRWGQVQNPDAFPAQDPFEPVKKPAYAEVPSDARTYTLEEGRRVLAAARKETSPIFRWMPWLCAFSGARVGEIAGLRKEDFYEVDGLSFFRLTTSGGRKLKTRASERRIPVHPALGREGLLDFVSAAPAGQLFPSSCQPRLSEWLRGKVGIGREHLAPNHGWRHLFEDQCTVGGVSDDARAYLTGRATGSSRDRYGRSQAALPGLHREMAKIPSIMDRPA